ncbi:hypothetical protein C5E09_10665 [Rathayibacter iranicus]|nr:hypothetical protein C5E09_10665 [Rathayibacter iranicus]PPI70240.1 hypothetical protein C5E01_10620 [Rathayibacter iranicus]
MWLLCGTQLLVAMEFSIINIAIPNLQDTFGVSPTLSHWVVTGYAVGFAALLFLGGRASERWGPKNVILWGISGFTMTSLLAALAWSFDVLIVARVAQGASAALVAPSALAFLTQLTSSAERPRWLGMWGAAASAGFAAGVVLGGVLVGVTGWRSVFVFCTILAATLGAAAASILPRMRESGERVDIIGALLFATASISLVAVLSLLSNESSRGPWLLGLAAVALLGFVSLSYQQRRTPNPLVPPELLARRSYALPQCSAVQPRCRAGRWSTSPPSICRTSSGGLGSPPGARFSQTRRRLRLARTSHRVFCGQSAPTGPRSAGSLPWRSAW